LTAVRSDIDDLQVDKFDSRIRQQLENPRGAWRLSVSATLVDSVVRISTTCEHMASSAECYSAHHCSRLNRTLSSHLRHCV